MHPFVRLSQRAFWVKPVPFDDEAGVTADKPPRPATEFVKSIRAKEFTEPAPGAWTNLGHLLAAVEADPKWAADVSAMGGRLLWSTAKLSYTEGERRSPSQAREPFDDLPENVSKTTVFIRVRFVPSAPGGASGGGECV